MLKTKGKLSRINREQIFSWPIATLEECMPKIEVHSTPECTPECHDIFMILFNANLFISIKYDTIHGFFHRVKP